MKYLENFKKLVVKSGIEPDLIDWQGDIDWNLSYSEIKAQVRELIVKLGRGNLEEFDKESEEALNSEQIKVYSEEVKAKLDENIDKIKSETDSSMLHMYYETLEHSVKMVVAGYTKSLFIRGRGGCGKTHNIISCLPSDKMVKIGGHITPQKLYKILYENRANKIIFFDDVDDMVNNDVTVALLKQALDTGDIREVMWDTSKETIDVPNNFILESPVIFCLNNIPKTMTEVLDRSDIVEIDFNYSELLEIMYIIAKNPRKINDKITLSSEERKELCDFIREESDDTTDNFSLRTQVKIENLYAFNSTCWKYYALKMLKKRDDNLLIVKMLIQSGKSVEEQIESFGKMTRHCRATYFNYKRKLKMRC